MVAIRYAMLVLKLRLPYTYNKYTKLKITVFSVVFHFLGKDHAFAALSIDDDCAEAHKWYALCLGSAGEYEPMNQKIKNGFIFKVSYHSKL